MRSEMVIVILLSLLAFCEAGSDDRHVEGRGKKKKIALFVYFADIVIKKIFVLKLIYAFVFWVIIHKAGYFLSWFATYLKEQKDDYNHHHYKEHGSSYGPYGYGRNRRNNKY